MRSGRLYVKAGGINRQRGIALGYAQANLVILPKKYAFDFFLFCQRNPRPCPVLEVLEPGDFQPDFLASEADVRMDAPRYNIYVEGDIESICHKRGRVLAKRFCYFLSRVAAFLLKKP